MTERRKVGIMGGTFDPIHMGHLILGESAWEQFGLEKILFMPSGNPPHKKNRHGATNEQRVEMVRLAIASNEHFELSLAEMHEQGYVYTKETLRRLRAQNPDTDYYFIIGADSLLSFDTWMCPQEICDQCILVAAVRDRMSVKELDFQIEQLKKRYNADIRKLESPNLDISSHTIRSRYSGGESIRYYVPDAVRTYIQNEDIYGNC